MTDKPTTGSSDAPAGPVLSEGAGKAEALLRQASEAIRLKAGHGATGEGLFERILDLANNPPCDAAADAELLWKLGPGSTKA